MNKPFFILCLLLTFNVFGQTERIVLLDSSIGDFYTHFFLVIGHEVDGKKEGEWNLYQYNSRDTTKFLSASEMYDNNKMRVTKKYKLDGYSEHYYSKNGVLKKESEYRYGNMTWQREYKNRKSVVSRTYYPNGQVSGEGPEVLVKIIAGCDAGMHVYQRVGEWVYYDTSGEEMDRQVYELKKAVFKKV